MLQTLQINKRFPRDACNTNIGYPFTRETTFCCIYSDKKALVNYSRLENFLLQSVFIT